MNSNGLLPPQEIPIGRVVSVRIHPGSGQKLEVLGVGIAKQHHHAVLASEVVPLATRSVDVSVRVPDPVARNDLGGGL